MTALNTFSLRLALSKLAEATADLDRALAASDWQPSDLARLETAMAHTLRRVKLLALAMEVRP
jgi:hypothetical protein